MDNERFTYTAFQAECIRVAAACSRSRHLSTGRVSGTSRLETLGERTSVLTMLLYPSSYICIRVLNTLNICIEERCTYVF